jgi:hypothetical protein
VRVTVVLVDKCSRSGGEGESGERQVINDVCETNASNAQLRNGCLWGSYLVFLTVPGLSSFNLSPATIDPCERRIPLLDFLVLDSFSATAWCSRWLSGNDLETSFGRRSPRLCSRYCVQYCHLSLVTSDPRRDSQESQLESQKTGVVRYQHVINYQGLRLS